VSEVEETGTVAAGPGSSLGSGCGSAFGLVRPFATAASNRPNGATTVSGWGFVRAWGVVSPPGGANRRPTTVASLDFVPSHWCACDSLADLSKRGPPWS
jgi:hypothetical protein